MGSYFNFGKRTWVWKGSKFGFTDLGLGSAYFWQNRFKVRNFLEGFESVLSSVLVDEPGFELLHSLNFERSGAPLIIHCFHDSLHINHYLYSSS